MPHEADVPVLLFAPTGDDELAAAFDRADRFELTVATDVDTALDALHGEEPPPQLLVMEFEGEGEASRLLQTIKDDGRLRRLPVVTISDDDDACVHSYDQRANAHVERPSTPAAFDDAVRRIESFWTRTATLPPQTDQ